jgi:uncharacterized membrane protein YhiD involved in acid resistance
MAVYNVPPDISEKEKIVGGVLTAAQLICILIGIGAAAVFSFLFFALLGTASIVIGVILFVPLGGAFALVKIKGLPLYEYLKRRRYHRTIVKKMPNYRVEADDFELKYTAVKKIIK